MKIKSVLAQVRETWYNKFPEWDKNHNYPETKDSWRERIPLGYWNAFNETYEAEDSFADDIGDPPYEFGRDRMMITSDESFFDRVIYAIHSEKRGLTREDERPTAEALSTAWDKAVAGDSVTVRFNDLGDPNHVTEVTFSGSADFYDFDDDTKAAYGEKWYRRWYDENRKRGLVDFEYSFPKDAGTNRDACMKGSFAAALEAWKKSAAGATFDDWLDMPATDEARDLASGFSGGSL